MTLAHATALVGVLAVIPAVLTAQEKTTDRQIVEAVSPLPPGLRSGATVLGYRGGELVVLREGSNVMICVADDPMRRGLHVACYHESLEPFMARGRQLAAEGKSAADRRVIREAEIEAGVLHMPEHPAALYSLTGEEGSVDPATGEASGAARLYVVYVPYATEETTGISARPTAEGPWLMGAGSAWAHIMYRR